MSRIEGGVVEALDNGLCLSWLRHVLGEEQAPERPALGKPAWVLCHCDDGVTWGVQRNGNWQLSSTVFPDFYPRPSHVNLQELRIFSREVETLIWRGTKGLRGRTLCDSPVPAVSEACAPHDEEHILLGGRIERHKDGFTCVGNGTGARQALPLQVDGEYSLPRPRIRIRHYFTQAEDTGCVRIVATRLVELV